MLRKMTPLNHHDQKEHTMAVFRFYKPAKRSLRTARPNGRKGPARGYERPESPTESRRDDVTIAVWIAVRERNHDGSATRQIADAVKVSTPTVSIDLQYLARCQMIERRGGLWYTIEKGRPPVEKKKAGTQ